MRKEDLMVRMAMDMFCRIVEHDTKGVDRILAKVITMGPEPTTYFVAALTDSFGFFTNCMKKNNSKNGKIVRCVIRSFREGISDTSNTGNGQYYDNPDSEK